jgi:hypothetical protein
VNGRTVAWTVAQLVLMLAGCVGALRAQTLGQLGAFDALMLSPMGALPPVARDGSSRPYSTEVLLRYGKWTYDANDGIHNNVGISIARRIGARTRVAVTGAYLSLDCDCAVWASGGMSLNSTLLSTGADGTGAPHATAYAAIAGHVGGARFTGSGGAWAISSAALLDIGGSVPFVRGTRIGVSVLPGVGAGHIASIDQTTAGVLPTIGGALAWSGRSFTLDIGTQRVLLQGTPPQLGMSLSWHRQ